MTDAKQSETSLLEEVMKFIRQRHNYGPRKRSEMRISLLKRYTELQDAPRLLRASGGDYNVEPGNAPSPCNTNPQSDWPHEADEIIYPTPSDSPSSPKDEA